MSSKDPLGLDGIRVSVALQYAQNPYVTKNLAASFGGAELHYNKESVAKEFGEVAATHWQAVIDNQKLFVDNARKHLKGD